MKYTCSIETVQQNGRFTLFSSKFPSNIYSILYGQTPLPLFSLFLKFEASQIYILHIACYFLWVQNMTLKGTENRRPKRLHIMNKENIKIGLTGLCRLPSLTYVLRTWHSPFNSQILSEQCTVPLILKYYLNNAQSL